MEGCLISFVPSQTPSQGGAQCFQSYWVLPGLINAGRPYARYLFSVEQLK